MILDKAKMAHEYAMLHMANPQYKDVDDLDMVQWAFDYADAMQAEADKRAVKFPDVFFDTKQNEEWQPDWSQAPEWANYIAVYSDHCNASYFEKEPKIISGYTWGGTDGKSLLTPIPVYAGNWQDSLRKRP